MQYNDVSIAATGYILPDHELSSAAIEEQIADVMSELSIPKGYLTKLTGIHSRRIWPIGTKPSSVASKAAKIALARSGLDTDIIKCLIHAGVCRDSLEPATAAVAHHNLSLHENCVVFDVSNACLGFLNSICIAADMIENKQIQAAMVISGENAGPIYKDTIASINKQRSIKHFEDVLASLTLGSGAVAYVLCHSSLLPNAPKIIGATTKADSTGHDLCLGNGNLYHQEMQTDTRQLMKKGLALINATWEQFCLEFDCNKDSFNHYFCHQISQSHHQKLMASLGINLSNTSNNLASLGNTGSVAAPLSMALLDNSKELTKGDKIALLGIGSGINCMMMAIEW